MLRHLIRPAPSSRAARRWSALAIVALVAARTAGAQLVTFTSRNGSNHAQCGASFGGPGAVHHFATPVVTHDVIAVSDPGTFQMSPSDATSALDAVPAPQGISILQSGAVMRGPLIGFASGATADARDQWGFAITAPTRFSFSVSLSATNSSGAMPSQSYFLITNGAGAQIILDPGVPSSALAGALFDPGTLAATASGMLLPGAYIVSLNGRAEGTNVWPHNGSFDHSLALGFDSGTVTTYCTGGTTSLGCTPMIQASGTPSASSTSGFVLGVLGLEGASQGLILYGTSGRSALAWGTSGSFLCVKSPAQRTGAQSAGGTAGLCDGGLQLDWSAFVATHPGALGVPFSVGQLVQAQGWLRDPPSPKSTMLSDALEFVLAP